jgi:hypothetical protein
MKLTRMLLALALLAVLAGVAYVSQLAEPTGLKMTGAADKFLTTLTPEQKSKATFAFDDKERINWWFVPRESKDKKPTRKGLPLLEMTDEQKKAALEMLRSGTSASGFEKATTIMSLEGILAGLEKGKGPTRSPGWYFFSVFGTPSKTGKWGWRVEGHHLSLNFTVDKGKLISATPAFFGANPATVMAGPRKGLRTLPGTEDLARELFKSLTEEQRKAAFQEKQFPEIEQAKIAPNVGEAPGLPAAKMNDKQRELLVKLIEDYASRMPADVAEVELGQVKAAGIDQVRFAYAGGVEPGQPHTYRVQGPTFVIEFLNLQADSAGNPANHIHSAQRNMKGDFGVAAK